MSGYSGTDVVTFPYVNAAEVVVLATILPLICLSTVALRFYTRMTKGYSVGVDDWLMVPGVILYVAMCICVLIGVAHGLIGHRSDALSNPPLPAYLVPKSDTFGKLFYSFQIFLVVGWCFIKCSIISLYRRIFVSEKNSKFDIVCKVMYGIVISWSITFFVIVNLSCGPKLTSFWGTKTEQSTCATFTPTRGLAGTDMVIDVALMLLPQPLIWRLGLSTGKKIVISILIALGCACIGADIAQTVLFTQIANASELDIPLDQNEIITLVMYYTCVDGGLAVTAACLVTLRPLFRNSSVSSFVHSFKSGFSGSTLRSSTSGAEPGAGKSWQSSGSTESSSGGTHNDDVEKAVRPWVATTRRTSGSLALAPETPKKGPRVVNVREISAPISLVKRTSDSVALAAKRCSNCGHGHGERC